MRHAVVGALLVCLSTVSGKALAADACGTVSIANGTWQSGEVLASLDKFILTKAFGCDVELVVGDTVPIITSMAEKGKPDVMPEAWINVMPEVVSKGVADGRLLPTPAALPDGGIQGLWIPKYIADQHPDIKTVGDALKHPELFPDTEDPTKGAIINLPTGSGSTIITAQLYKATDAEKKGFKLVDPGSMGALDGAIVKAYNEKRGFITYYWSPTSLLGKYPMVKLDEGVPYDAVEWKRCNTVIACPDPKLNAWPVDRVVTLMSKSFAAKAPPNVKQYFERRSWSNATVNKVMAWMTDNQASGDDAAAWFLKNNGDMWQKWLDPASASTLKASF